MPLHSPSERIDFMLWRNASAFHLERIVPLSQDSGTKQRKASKPINACLASVLATGLPSLVVKHFADFLDHVSLLSGPDQSLGGQNLLVRLMPIFSPSDLRVLGISDTQLASSKA